MKKTSRLLLTLVALIGFSAGVYALDFKAGEYYFDNSKLHFNNVKMVMGGDDRVVVHDMMPSNDVPWLRAYLSMDVTNLKGFCFINSTIDAGTYYESLDNFLERVAASSANFRQTKVRESIGREPQHLIGWVFCPLNDFEISDGYWRPLSHHAQCLLFTSTLKTLSPLPTRRTTLMALFGSTTVASKAMPPWEVRRVP